MSVTVSVDIFCDFCPDWTEGGCYNYIKVRVARKKAKERGWVYKKRGICYYDICPKCQKRMKENE